MAGRKVSGGMGVPGAKSPPMADVESAGATGEVAADTSLPSSKLVRPGRESATQDSSAPAYPEVVAMPGPSGWTQWTSSHPSVLESQRTARAPAVAQVPGRLAATVAQVSSV